MRQVSDIMSSTSSYGYYLLPNTYYLLPNTYYLIKELLNLLDHHTQAEYNDMVSGTNQRISGYEHSFAIANHTSDGCPLGNPRSLIKFLVIFAPAGTVNSATSALANVRHLTLDTSASSII